MMSPSTFVLICLVCFVIPLLVQRFGREFLVALLPIYLIIGNVFAQSFVVLDLNFLWGWKPLTSVAVPIYSTTFLLTDILFELHGKESAKRAIYVGFVGQACLMLGVFAVLASPVIDLPVEYGKQFHAVFGTITLRLVAASFIAYWASQLLDVLIYAKIREKTGERKLWLRNNVGTMFSQLVDTFIFMFIAFWGSLPFETWNKWIAFVLTTWAVKCGVALIDTPYVYLSKFIARRNAT